MSLRDELSEPWGILTAALLGGLGGAVTAATAPVAVIGVPVGLAIAGVVYGVKVGAAAFGPKLFDDAARRAAQRRGLIAGTDQLPGAPPLRPRPGSPADQWLRRAEAAVYSLRIQTESVADPVLRAQVADVDDQGAAVLDDLRRVAGHVVVVESSASQIDVRRLEQERQGVQRSLKGLSQGRLRDERERSLQAVKEQLEVYDRLDGARDTLVAQLQSTTLGLEGLVARLAELLALHVTAGSTSDDQVARLADELDGMRAGLAESEDLSQQVLRGGSSAERPTPISDPSG